jgi:tRNA A-37 threonylcarbamoyl transferase component Bud32
MAEVFLARRRGAAGIAKRLVVKRVRQDLASDPRFAELFLREARVATQLSHKNIVTVFDVGRDHEGLFLAMEYVAGPDLAAAMEGARDRGMRFDPLVAAHIASEVAAGLDHAHRLRDESGDALGLVHRDVTPRNILLSLDGEVKVTDFGVAVLGGDAVDVRRGTVPYMAPEQAGGQPVDARADLFSLGLVLHELLSGHRAYEGGDKDAMLALARAGVVPPLPSEVPVELAQVVARATAVSRDERLASARDMQRELAGWAVGERSRRGEGEPLEHALASFLAQAVPDWGEQVGEDANGRAVGVAGTGTLRSVAETVGDERARAEAERAPDDRGEPSRRSLRRSSLLVGAGLVLAAAVVVLAVARRSGPHASEGAPAERSTAASEGAAGTAPAPAAPPAIRTGDRAAPPREAPEPPATEREADRAPGGSLIRPHRASATARARPGPRGRLDLNAVPWAYVSIDGGPEVETPIRGRALSAGRHKIVIRNPVLEKQREIAIDIAAGETTRYVVDLNR